jgi:hypothetical protein
VAAAFVSSTNGGSTWSGAKRIEGPIKLPWLPQAGGYFLGDYISTSFGSNGKAYPVIANAASTGSNCALGAITSCNEFMISPANGLAAIGGTIPAGHGRPVGLGRGAAPSGRPLTAF